MALASVRQQLPSCCSPSFAHSHSPTAGFGTLRCQGLSEPLGAFLTLVLLKPVFNITGEQLGGVLCGVAGVMSCVSCVELLPQVACQLRCALACTFALHFHPCLHYFAKQALQHGSRYDVGMGALAGFGVTLLSLLLGA